MASQKYVTASEIGDFVYCKRAWWLRLNGFLKTTPKMAAGTLSHEAVFRKVNLSPRLLLIAVLLIGIAILALILLITNLLL